MIAAYGKNMATLFNYTEAKAYPGCLLTSTH